MLWDRNVAIGTARLMVVPALALACHGSGAASALEDTTRGGSEPIRVIAERTTELTLEPALQHSPAPGAEAALRRHIESVGRGEPNYADMVPELSRAIAAQPGVLAQLASLGQIESVTFKGRGPLGGSLYDVSTERGVTEWRIRLAPDGKIEALFFEEAAPDVAPTEPELVKAIEARLDAASAADGFSGVVLLAKHGRPIFEAARGLADRELGIETRLETKFRIASMGKMFTAVAVLQLVEAGKLKLDAPLGEYLDDYPNPEVAKSVTLHHLLTHTGGTGDIFGPEYNAHRRELLTHRDYVELYGTRALAFAPGERFEYSNYGFVLLGRVVEEASGQRYHDYVEAHVLGPAGMKATGYRREGEPLADMSVGYQRDPSGLKPNVDSLPPRATAAGGAYSTTGDMLRFANALTGHRLLSEASTRLLTTGKVSAGGSQYAYGFMDHTEGGPRFFGHGGGAPGMNGDFKIFPDSGHVLVVLSNLDPPASSRIAQFITVRMPGATKPAPVAAALVETTPPRARDSAFFSGPNLVKNGDFEAGDALWSTMLWPSFPGPGPAPQQPVPVEHRIQDGALCVAVSAAQNVVVGWPGGQSSTVPSAFELLEGQAYRLSFRASSAGGLPVRVVAKVGHQDMPYTPAVQAPIPVAADPQRFAVDFEPARADPKAGIAFILSAPRGNEKSDVCFDDVSLARGP